MTFRRKVKEYAEAPITHQIVAEMLPEYNRPNDKISELLKNGELLAVRRGLYVPGPETDLSIPNSFLIANHLRGPSYISLESALSYWNIIPERVYQISSVTLKTTKNYTTPIGRFSYQYLAAPYYSFGVQSVKLAAQQTALIASPEKALCDKIILTSGVLLRSISQTRDFLLDDMRMDEEILRTLNISTIQSWIEDAPKKNSLQMLIKTLEQL
ncbi:MAG: hypothetical protein RJA25_271 [Bacteroidota bacterium]|jgi:predicted transcriptional regulator of viral defense system